MYNWSMLRIKEKSIREIFFISLVLKGLDSLLEILGGVLFLFTGTVTTLLTFLIQKELIEDPTDFVANQIQHSLPYFSGHAQSFGAFYLLSHGIVKIILVVSILRGKFWAYPAMIVVLFLFIIYQLYRFSYTHSSFLLLLTLFDLLIIVLTWHEYRVVKKHLFKVDKFI